jgi:hypothetical protein
MSLVRRALGSLPDAAWIRRQFTNLIQKSPAANRNT